ncbi:CAP domain-containing protein [Leptospira idonii]|nr:CAP domain-containing protein [Leptospira idonii]
MKNLFCRKTIIQLALMTIVFFLFPGLLLSQDASETKLFPLWPENRPSLDLKKALEIYSEISKKNSTRAPYFGKPFECVSGTPDASWMEGQKKLLNLYRSLAGSPDLQYSEEMNSKAAKGALITAANRWPNHYPPKTSKCYSEEGAYVTAHSSLSHGAIHTSIHDWIDDNGVTDVGHRLPTIHPGTLKIGIGAVGDGMVLFSEDMEKNQKDSYLAIWPPPGFVPKYFALGYKSFTFSITPSMNKTDVLDFGTAEAKVKLNGWPRPVISSSKRPWGSFLFEVGFGDQTKLEKALKETGVSLDVSVGPVTIRGKKAEIRYRIVFYDSENEILPTVPMKEPGFYPWKD